VSISFKQNQRQNYLHKYRDNSDMVLIMEKKNSSVPKTLPFFLSKLHVSSYKEQHTKFKFMFILNCATENKRLSKVKKQYCNNITIIIVVSENRQ
jgi:hypothetical protein